MAVIRCKLKNQEYTAAEQNSDRQMLTYLAETDGPMSLPAILEDCYTATPNAIPRRYTYVGSGMYVLQITVSPRNDDSRTLFKLVVECGKPAMQELTAYADPEDYLLNPLTRVPVFGLDVETYLEKIEKDKNDRALVNACGDKFDEPIERDSQRAVITIRRNLPTSAHAVVLNQKFKRTANSDVINYQGLTFAAGALQWRGAFCSDPVIENTTQYYPTTIRIAAESRNVEILNRGHRARPAAGDPPVWVTDEEGQRLPDPVLLNADGTRLAEGGTPTFMTYDVYKDKAFAPLFANTPIDFNAI